MKSRKMSAARRDLDVLARVLARRLATLNHDQLLVAICALDAIGSVAKDDVESAILSRVALWHPRLVDMAGDMVNRVRLQESA